jgi:membrane protein implicated in regulation of membrane protease activity
MMFEWVYWHWLAIAAVLLIVELLAPGLFFLWLAVAAALTGTLLLLLPDLSLNHQMIAFSVLAIINIGLFRRIFQRYPTKTDEPRLNRRAEQCIGRVFTLEHPIVNGQGKLRVDDSWWKIEGDDCAAGEKVKVVAAAGVILQVQVHK